MAVIQDDFNEAPVVAIYATHSESHLATPEAVPAMRHAIAAYAESVGVDGAQLEGVRLAVSEAISNVVLHAYDEPPGYVHVTARVVDDELWIFVTDEGRGHNSAPLRSGLGWGLAFITEATDEFALAERAEGGTEARMVFRISPR